MRRQVLYPGQRGLSLLQICRSLVVSTLFLAASAATTTPAGERQLRDGRQAGSGIYRLNAGDTLGVYVEGVLGDAKSGIPSSAPCEAFFPVRTGFPLRIGGDGTISVPWIPAVDVRTKTVAEVQVLLEDAFRDLYDRRSDLSGKQPDLAVTLMRKRPATEPKTYRVRPGDVLGIFIGGIIGDIDSQPPGNVRSPDGASRLAKRLGLAICFALLACPANAKRRQTSTFRMIHHSHHALESCSRCSPMEQRRMSNPQT